MRTTRSAWRWLQPKRCVNSGTNSRRWEGLKPFFCDHRLQHRLVQAQIGHDLLELAVLLLKLAQAAQLGRTDAAVAPLPDIEGRFNMQLRPDFVAKDDELATLSTAQRVDLKDQRLSATFRAPSSRGGRTGRT